ncbi:tape measure protein [Limosilactobacillus coleohominis]|uniref:tape measure protein n=1 Tax=Limosilactobacillus coleohominis TaxID=181675 RepID=UPI002A90F42E|nr:tape measure protein [Limosilactobacillus coleohominis]MDY5628846.1 tape measure protein [Limosilactobacillus coleohominis]
MADGTVNIDVVLNSDQAKSNAREVDTLLKSIGKGAGDEAEKSIKESSERAVKDTEEAHQKMSEELKKPVKTKIDADAGEATEKVKKIGSLYVKIPKEVKTRLIAEAKDQGITNFDKLLKKIPKKQLTELVAQVKRGEVVNYEELLRKIPAKVATEVKLNDKASLPLKQVTAEAKNTGHTFSRLHDIIAGSFVGGLAVSGINAVKNGLIGAAKAGMEYNVQQDRMKTVWTALTTEAPKDGKQLISFINDISQHSIYASDTIDRMAQSFYHVHSSVKETKQWTNDFVRLGSTLHMSNDELAEAGEQFAKIVAGGKASAEDMSVMINRFPMFGEALQKATGKSMAQLYDMSAKGKLTAKEFEEALDYLGKKYKNSTEEAMTSFTGMSMYIKSRWQVLWGEVTQQGFKGSKKLSEDLRDILSDKMIEKYAGLLSQALGTILEGVMAVLNYIGRHKDTIVDVLGNLGQIIGIIGKTVWGTFAGILHAIASAFGLTSDKSKGAHGALEDFDSILKDILAHKGAIKAFTEVFLAIFIAKKIYDTVDALIAFYGILKTIAGLRGIGGVMKGIGAGARGESLATSAEEIGAGGLEATKATKTGRFVGRGFDHLFGISAGRQAVSGPASVMENGAGKAAIRAGERGIIRRTASRIPVVGSLIAGGTELIGINRRNRNEKIGRAVGATGGTAAGGAAGSFIGGAIGSLILPGAGTAVGAGIGSLIGSTAGGIFGAKGGGAIGKNFNSIKRSISREASSLGKSVEKTFSNIGRGISKVWSTITKPIVKVLSGLKKTLVTLAKGIGTAVLAPFVILVGAIIKAWQKLSKPIGNVLKTISKLIQNAWKSITKLTSKTWKGITKTVTKAFDAIKKPIQRSLKATGKLIQTAWRTISRTTTKVWRTLSRTVQKAVQAMAKPIERIFNSIAKVVSRTWRTVERTTQRVWNSIERIINRTLGGVWKFVRDKFDDMKDAIDDAMNGIKKIWDSIWDAMSDKVKAVWDTIKGVVTAGINAIGGFWNTGADGLEKVAGFFGAKVKVPHMKKLAGGTGGRQGENMLAMVNDQEGPLYREAIFRNTGHIEVPEGRNVITRLQPGDAVMPAKQTAQLLGIPRYEGGFGDWFGKAWNYASSKIGNLEDMIDDKLDAIEDALKDPLGTLVKIYTHGTNSAKVMWHDIAEDGARNKIPHYAEQWFKDLLKRQEEKLDEVGGNGPISASLIRRAAHKMKVDVSAGDIQKIMNVIMHESRGQAHAINNWDSNAKAGTPSKGILQFIEPTFRSYAMPGHTNIWSPYDQLLAMFNDSTWRSDLHTGGWGPTGGRRFANGGWTDEPGIFGEIPGEPELAINPQRPTAEQHIAEAIEARAKYNPSGFAGGLARMIQSAKVNGQGFISNFNHQASAVSNINTNVASGQPKDENLNLTMEMDGNVIGRLMFPRMKANMAQERIIYGNGGAIPVGRAMPVGGGF